MRFVRPIESVPWDRAGVDSYLRSIHRPSARGSTTLSCNDFVAYACSGSIIDHRGKPVRSTCLGTFSGDRFTSVQAGGLTRLAPISPYPTSVRGDAGLGCTVSPPCRATPREAPHSNGLFGTRANPGGACRQRTTAPRDEARRGAAGGGPSGHMYPSVGGGCWQSTRLSRIG